MKAEVMVWGLALVSIPVHVDSCYPSAPDPVAYVYPASILHRPPLRQRTLRHDWSVRLLRERFHQDLRRCRHVLHDSFNLPLSITTQLCCTDGVSSVS